jgi:NAD(P)H dehydrogenase (quinone)
MEAVMNKEKRILVYLANGVQGGAVVRQAVSRGHAVRALVRDPGKSGGLKKLGVEVMTGDLQSGAGLHEAHQGIDYVVLQMPLGVPSQMGPLIDNAIDAIKMSRVKGVVVKVGSGKPAIQTDVPAFVLNQIIEEKMRDSTIPFSIVRPTMYLDNFLRPDTREGIRSNGVILYSLPARQKIAWTSADDAAKAALTLLENEIFGGGEYIVSGVNAVDGDSLAAAFSKALKRDVRFQSLPLGPSEHCVDLVSGAAMGRRLAMATLQFIEANPDEASKFLSRPFSPSPQLRDFLPASIETWVTEHSSLFV